MSYTIRRIARRDGKTEWGVYENDHLIDTFLSYGRAYRYMIEYARLMR